MAWEPLLARLAAYKMAQDCNVLQGWAEDPRLASWVHSQRTHKGRIGRGEPRPAGLTAKRAARLTALGLNWLPV
jgi:hypothetical protein